jgi:hypothetical protein
VQWRREWRIPSASRRAKQSKAAAGEKLTGQSADGPLVHGALRDERENRAAERQPETHAATRAGTLTGQPREQPVETIRAAACIRVWEEAESQ